MALRSTAFEILKKQYDSSGKDYEIRTRPYYSSGGIVFSVVDSVTIGGVTKAFAVAVPDKQNTLYLFSYGKGADANAAVNIGPNRKADDQDTNQSEGNRTNGEDFAIEGFSATSRGVRVAYTAAVVAALAGITDQFVQEVLRGDKTIDDPGSVILPPEAGSPVVLEDLFYRALGSKITLTTAWNRKAVDLIGCLDELPEAGGKSYLRSNGEPSTHNFMRVPEGLIWKHEGSAEDTLFNLIATLQDTVMVPISQTTFLQNAGPPADVLGMPFAIVQELKVRAEGRAFYVPSRNA